MMKMRKKTAKNKIPIKRKIVKRKPATGIINGIEYESGCEKAALDYFHTLKKSGYVSRIERSESFLITEPVLNTYVEQLKKSSKTVQQTILNGQSYTADFKVYFTKKADGIFTWDIDSNKKYPKNHFIAKKIDNEYLVYLEVKPDHSRNSTTPKAVNSMKVVYWRHKIFINLFRPDKIFSSTFTPDEYRTTESGTARKLRFKAITLQEYLKTRK